MWGSGLPYFFFKREWLATRDIISDISEFVILNILCLYIIIVVTNDLIHANHIE